MHLAVEKRVLQRLWRLLPDSVVFASPLHLEDHKQVQEPELRKVYRQSSLNDEGQVPFSNDVPRH